MKLTTKGEYSLRLLIDLARNSNGRTVRVAEMARRQKLSFDYIEQLTRRLRSAGILKAVRGPGGGYILARDMNEIKIKEIMVAANELINPGNKFKPSPECTREARDVNEFFSTMGVLIDDYLSTTTLGDLVRRQINPITVVVPKLKEGWNNPINVGL